MFQVVKFKTILMRKRETDDAIIVSFYLTFELDSYCTAYSSAYIHNLFNNEIDNDFFIKKLQVTEDDMDENHEAYIEKLNEYYCDKYVLLEFILMSFRTLIYNIKEFNKFNIIM